MAVRLAAIWNTRNITHACILSTLLQTHAGPGVAAIYIYVRGGKRNNEVFIIPLFLL